MFIPGFIVSDFVLWCCGTFDYVRQQSSQKHLNQIGFFLHVAVLITGVEASSAAASQDWFPAGDCVGCPQRTDDSMVFPTAGKSQDTRPSVRFTYNHGLFTSPEEFTLCHRSCVICVMFNMNNWHILADI